MIRDRIAIGLVVAWTGVQAQAMDLRAIQPIFGEIDTDALISAHALLDIPESQVDFAHAKLTIDRLIDPSINQIKEAMRL